MVVVCMIMAFVVMVMVVIMIVPLVVVVGGRCRIGVVRRFDRVFGFR